MIALPAMVDPTRYRGLYAFDFGDQVSIGYTAGEIRHLRQSPAHQGGTIYEIYRVDESSKIELRGVRDTTFFVQEAICFLRFEGTKARFDFDEISRAALAVPLPCSAELRLARSYAFDPAELTALVYPGWAGHHVSSWLHECRLEPGDRVEGGVDAYRALESSGGITIAMLTLPTSAPPDRSNEEVLNSINQPLQR